MYQEVDPDELFRMFFGAGLNGGGGGGAFGPGVRFQQFHMGGRGGGVGGGFNRPFRAQQAQPQQAELSSIAWMFAMLFIFFSLFWGNNGAHDSPVRPPHSFQPVGQLQTARSTSGMNGLVRGIPYFVNSQFAVWARVPENLYSFEAQIQDRYATYLTGLCKVEKDKRSRDIAYARTEKDKAAALSMTTPRSVAD